jgi:hypothetical protein
MDEILPTLTTPEACENFEKMALERGRPDLAVGARKRAIELRASEMRPKTDVERECWIAIHAYERALAQVRGRKTRASRTRQMIDRHGMIGAVERAVNRPDDPTGFTMLLDLGLQDYAFEAVVLRHESSFSSEAVQRSRERLSKLNFTPSSRS